MSLCLYPFNQKTNPPPNPEDSTSLLTLATSGLVRFVNVHSIGAATLSQHKDARILRGIMNLFVPKKKTWMPWLWEATGYPLSDGCYHWNTIVLCTDEENGLFTEDRLHQVAAKASVYGDLTRIEHIAHFMVGLLTHFSRSNAELIKNDMEYTDAKQPQVVTGTYHHFKDGSYEVVGVAIKAGSEDTDDKQPLVIYCPNYGDHGLRWRTLAEFTETVETPAGTVPRFALENAVP